MDVRVDDNSTGKISIPGDDLICRQCFRRCGFRLNLSVYDWFEFKDAHTQTRSTPACWVCNTTKGQCIQVFCIEVPL